MSKKSLVLTLIATFILGFIICGVIFYSFFGRAPETVKVEETSVQSKPVIVPAAPQQQPVQRNITIKAAIIYKQGGPQPVARENFYLLNKDVVQEWNITNYVDQQVFCLNYQEDHLLATKNNTTPKYDIKPYIVNTTTTDFEGNATFANVPEGDYYIFGISQTRGACAFWSYKVSANEGKTVFLDNNNAIAAR